MVLASVAPPSCAEPEQQSLRNKVGLYDQSSSRSVLSALRHISSPDSVLGEALCLLEDFTVAVHCFVSASELFSATPADHSAKCSMFYSTCMSACDGIGWKCASTVYAINANFLHQV